MFDVPTTRFLNRVIASEDVVTFSFSDPYGHMNTCRYLEMFVNHRIVAPDEQIGISTMALVKQSSLGLVFEGVNLRFLRPALLNDKLTVCSWTPSVHSTGFVVKGLLFDTKSLSVKCTVTADLRSVDLRTGRPVPMPATFPCTSEALVLQRPLAAEFLKPLKGVPDNFLAE